MDVLPALELLWAPWPVYALDCRDQNPDTVRSICPMITFGSAAPRRSDIVHQTHQAEYEQESEKRDHVE